MKTLKSISLALLASLFLFGLSSCDDENGTSGSLKVQYEFVFGSNMLPWQLGQTMKHPKTGDTLTFTTFKFYVSNVRLQMEDGTWWEEPNSYHIVCAGCPDAAAFSIDEIPAGTYTQMEYTLGVDSAACVNNPQTGALSPTEGMFWDWTNGYIMLKAEGSSPQSATGSFTFHLGGYTGNTNCILKKSTNFFGTPITISNGAIPVAKFRANPARLWHSAPTVATTNSITSPAPEAATMSNTFFDNISFTGME